MNNLKLQIVNLKMKIAVLFLMSGLIVIFPACENVEKPAVNGKGKLRLDVMQGLPAPDYHKPADAWKAEHMDYLNAGKYKTEECLACHINVDAFCNKCHEYIGAKKVSAVKQK